MEATIKRLRQLVEHACRELIDDDHPLRVEAVGGSENLLFEVYCGPGDVGLIIGRQGRNIEAIRTIVRSACRGATIRACSFAIPMFDVNGWLVAKAAAVCVSLLSYLVFAVFTVIWAIKVGEIGVHQAMTFQAKFYYWHGISVVACLVLAAGGSFIVLLAGQMKEWLGDA